MLRQLGFPMYQRGDQVYGQALAATGVQQFRPMIRRIQETKTASVLFCVMRSHGQGFLHQAREVSLLKKRELGG